MAEIGAPAPDFTVPVIGGGDFSLSVQLETENKPVLLNMWASWCPPCRLETPEISAFAESHPEVKVIGVAVEDREESSIEFAEEFAPSYDLAIGDEEFENAYPRLGLPVTYFIDSEGTVTDVINGIVTEEVLEGLASTDSGVAG